MISVVSKAYGIHPQTLRLYEREGLLKPSRTEGNTRLYSEADLKQLEVILNLTRELGVNLAGVEIVLNMRRKMEQVQGEVGEVVSWGRQELARAREEGWREPLRRAGRRGCSRRWCGCPGRRRRPRRPSRPSGSATAPPSSAAYNFPSRPGAMGKVTKSRKPKASPEEEGEAKRARREMATD